MWGWTGLSTMTQPPWRGGSMDIERAGALPASGYQALTKRQHEPGAEEDFGQWQWIHGGIE